MKPKILVLSGGPGGERAVSLKSGRMVAEMLDRSRFNVIQATLTQKLDFIFLRTKTRYRFLDGLKQLKKMRIDCVFPALHGEFGEDGKLQAILEILEIPFVGSGSVASGIAMDKEVSNALFRDAGLRIPRTYTVRGADGLMGLKSFLRGHGSFVVKPLYGGSSVGIMITNDHRAIERRVKKDVVKNEPVMVQEYLKGREITCGVIERSARSAMSLVPTEIRPNNATFFDYHAKYAIGGSDEITPPNLPSSKIREVQSLALRAHAVLGCRGMSRSDFILVKNQFYILETNTLPGMTKTSLLPQGAQACGIGFSDLLTILVKRGMGEK